MEIPRDLGEEGLGAFDDENEARWTEVEAKGA